MAIVYCRKLPSAATIKRETKTRRLILIADKKVLARCERRWRGGFDQVIAVQAGEKLKSLESFRGVGRKILAASEGFDRAEVALVALGGGSVGDFAGFAASLIKRGLVLVHIPTTWLAAADSAHGGKTALNLDGWKNQIGTFYPARRTYCVREVLLSQPQHLAREAYGEFAKMAFLSGGRLYLRLVRAGEIDGRALWDNLPLVVDAKMRVVRSDPKEVSGVRTLLNLGHTVGHVIEADAKIPHGVAVWHGLDFAIFWSVKKRLLDAKTAASMQAVMRKVSFAPVRLSGERTLRGLMRDKKATGGRRMRFIFLRGSGRPVIKRVGINEIVKAVKQWKASSAS